MTLFLKLALIGHVLLGLIGLTFYYAIIPSFLHKETNLNFLKRLSITGFVALVISWILAGYYYIQYYGQAVKPVIKSGKIPWAHHILMESKEHIFLFLPFLGLVLVAALWSSKSDIGKDDSLHKALAGLTFVIVALGSMITIFGVVISGALK